MPICWNLVAGQTQEAAFKVNLALLLRGQVGPFEKSGTRSAFPVSYFNCISLCSLIFWGDSTEDWLKQQEG